MALLNLFRFKLPWVYLRKARRDCLRGVRCQLQVWCSSIGPFMFTLLPSQYPSMPSRMLTMFQKQDMKWCRLYRLSSPPFAFFCFGDWCLTLGRPTFGSLLHLLGPFWDSCDSLCKVMLLKWVAAWPTTLLGEIDSMDKWDRLKRSSCPISQKYMVLPMAFWSSALYGAASCPLADSYLHQLRQAANKALRCKHAGSNLMPYWDSLWATKYVGVLLEFWTAGACGNHPLMVASLMALLGIDGGLE